jgi:hypothetical protein
MEVKVSENARATAARRGLKEAYSKRASRWTRTGYKALVPDERATYREVAIWETEVRGYCTCVGYSVDASGSRSDRFALSYSPHP